MVAAFGSVDTPTSNDPTKMAQALASFVKTNQLDGCDVDYEGRSRHVHSWDERLIRIDSIAFSSGKAEPWLISPYQRTLGDDAFNH